MENVSLYRKYRPHDFDNLVGQDNIKMTLVNAIKSDRVAHAYLFTGPRGTGKTSTARLIAKSINCAELKDGFNPCNSCEICQGINEASLIDLIEIDAASNRGIDEIRDLKEKINFSPTRAKFKVYIIDEVHMLTREAFNALLKTLEEPPAHAYFVLATTEVHKIPDTIISRCQRFDFKRISDDDMKQRLEVIAKAENIDAEEAALQVISKYADGGMRDAIGFLEQLTVDQKLELKNVQEVLGICNSSFLNELFETMMGNKTDDALRLVHELHIQGSDLNQFSHELIDHMRLKMLDCVSAKKVEDTVKLIKMIEIFQEAQQNLDSSIPQLPIEIAVIRVSFLFDYKAKKVQVEEVAVVEPKIARAESVVVEKAKILQAESPVVQKAEVASQPDPSVKRDLHRKAPKGPCDVTPPSLANTEVEQVTTLDIANLKEKWPRITERIKQPSLRMSLKGAVPLQVDGNTITLEFSTNFHKEKVMEQDNRPELEAVIKELFGIAVKIESMIKPLEIRPAFDEEVSVSREDFAIQQASGAGALDAPAPNEAPPPLINEALEIFGGEVVD